MLLMLILTTLALLAIAGKYRWNYEDLEMKHSEHLCNDDSVYCMNTFVYMSYLYASQSSLSKCWVCSHIPTHGGKGGIPLSLSPYQLRT